MKWDCARVDDAISDWARGMELPEAARRHIARCPACAQSLEEARAFSELVQSADCVPPAPDCRSAVMARISKPPRSAWVYAWAAVPLAIIIGAIILMAPGSHPPAPRTAVVRRSPPVRQHTPAPTPKVIVRAPDPVKVAVERTRDRRRISRPRPSYHPEAAPVQQKKLEIELPQPDQVCVVKPSEPDTPPVAMVYVTWDKPNLDRSYTCVISESENETTPEQNGGTGNETNGGT